MVFKSFYESLWKIDYGGTKYTLSPHLAMSPSWCFKDRVHFLTQASAGFVKRPKMVLWGSGKLKTMFFDDFEQYEKIEFVDFLYGHIFFYVKKIYLG